jgi:hypothetical protein
MTTNYEDWQKRIESLSDDDLIKQLTLNADDYQEDYLSTVREYLSQRGYQFIGEGKEANLITPSGVRITKIKEESPTPELIDLSLRGVGGWLGLFIIGQLILRPLQVGHQIFGSNVDLSRLSTVYPTLVTMVYIEIGLFSFLILFGVVVALILWKVYTPIAVTLAKAFLVTNVVIFLLDLLLTSYVDLPLGVDKLLTNEATANLITGTIWAGIWFFYFIKSKRVQATYFAESIVGDEEVTSLRLR